MLNSRKPSASSRKAPGPGHWVWSAAADIFRTAGRQLFGSTRQEPIGYWTRDRRGKWRLYIRAYRADEAPPTS